MPLSVATYHHLWDPITTEEECQPWLKLTLTQEYLSNTNLIILKINIVTCTIEDLTLLMHLHNLFAHCIVLYHYITVHSGGREDGLRTHLLHLLRGGRLAQEWMK